MDNAKAKFLFGRVPTDLDPDERIDRAILLEQTSEYESDSVLKLFHGVIATQIAEADPPEVWETIERLLAHGMGRDQVLDQLIVLLSFLASRRRLDDDSLDRTAYIAALSRLPVPEEADVEATINQVVVSNPGIDIETLRNRALSALGKDPDDLLTGDQFDWLIEEMLDPDGSLAMLSPDRVVHVAELTPGLVLTHRLTETERRTGILDAGIDLCGFARVEEPHLSSGDELSDEGPDRRAVQWLGPDGWLERFTPGALLAVRVDPEGTVSVEETADPTPATAEGRAPDRPLVAQLRSAYDDEHDGLPVIAEDLLLAMRLDDREAFTTPGRSLVELCELAGLECRGHEVAHDPQAWVNADRVKLLGRLVQALDDEPAVTCALEVLDASADPDVTGDPLVEVIAAMREPGVLDVVVDELADQGPEGRALGFAGRLLQVAKQPKDIAVARLFAARVCEDEGDVLVADTHLAIGLSSDPTWPPLVDRCAWYASDKGNAKLAARLWRSLHVDSTRIDEDLEIVERFSRATGKKKLGRNEPCWCGSGRKFKACHLDAPETVPLADRIDWLIHKAVSFMGRNIGAAELAVWVGARTVDPEDDDSIRSALEDPIVFDTLLTEGGWFERFLAARDALLPDDEALLAASWCLVPRTIYEVLETRPGIGVTLQDLGGGERVEVSERTFSREAFPGLVVCARALPDGVSHQLGGAVFSVRPGTEPAVLRMCDERAGLELCSYVASLYRPPTLVTREDEPLVACTAVVRVPATARDFLDATYESRDGQWFEVHDLRADFPSARDDRGDRTDVADHADAADAADADQIIRAQMSLDGDTLTVVTHSEERMDRVLATLRGAIPELAVLSDQRDPLSAADQMKAPFPINKDSLVPSDEMRTAVQETMEARWLSENIPALDGLTPVQAAADPSRVEVLERLLASFPEPDDRDFPGIAMRPSRLRELLGLPSR